MKSLSPSTSERESARARVVDANHINRLDSLFVLNINQLYNSAPVHVQNMAWRWEYIADQPIRYRLSFVSQPTDDDDVQTLVLELVDDIIETEVSAIPWASYDGAMRLAAWTAAHDQFVELLCHVFGVDWTLESISATTSSDGGNGHGVGFSARRDKNVVSMTRGNAYFSVDLLPALLARTEPLMCSMLWRRCEAYARFVIDAFSVSARDFQMFESDGIVLIDNQSLASIRPRVQVIAGKNRWLAEIDNTTIKILARSDRGHDDASTLFEDTNMEPQHDVSDVMNRNTEGDVVATAVDTASVPITLCFEAGRLVIPFERLQSIQPGFVFELDHGLDQQTITIYANNSLVATGELVLVDDRIGVRLTGGRPAITVPLESPAQI